jgi:hypothetical protein
VEDHDLRLRRESCQGEQRDVEDEPNVRHVEYIKHIAWLRLRFTQKPRIFTAEPTEYAPERARLGVLLQWALRGALSRVR